jgi:para-aminobenzoate synthetase/4-amino-4-deoxychorismate lyase
VAIRTATIRTENRAAVYPVGSGITWDAEAEKEYAECLAKAAVLAERGPDVALFETLRWENGQFWLLARHLDRLCDSADYFGFSCRREDVQRALLHYAAGLGQEGARIRLVLHRSGALDIAHGPLPPATPLRLGWALTPVNSREVYLFHKTTRREVYEGARAARPEVDDVLLQNERGEVTESTMANIVIERQGRKHTPARHCGLLAGVFRAELLARGEIEEAVLHREDVARAERVWLINSLRGWIETLPGIA